jgi:hypothetical protein
MSKMKFDEENLSGMNLNCLILWDRFFLWQESLFIYLDAKIVRSILINRWMWQGLKYSNMVEMDKKLWYNVQRNYPDVVPTGSIPTDL